MGEAISREEHEEFAKRLYEENKRQDRRIELLEQSVKEMSSLTASVQRLASNMESTLKELEKQGKRLETLEGRDGEMWRKVVSYAITAAISILVGYAFSKIGITG